MQFAKHDYHHNGAAAEAEDGGYICEKRETRDFISPQKAIPKLGCLQPHRVRTRINYVDCN